MINKGFISSISADGNTAIVIPQEASATVTIPLVIPVFLLECLNVNMPVVYTTFPDSTGIILARLDGEWNHKIYRTLTVEGTTHITERITADSGITADGGILASGGISASGGGDVSVNGNIVLNGSLNASAEITAPTIIASGVSLVDHVHLGVTKGEDESLKPKAEEA